YQATYQLPRAQRTHAAQVGALLRKTDRAFSYEKYNFTKLIELLESVPDLVDIERVVPNPGDPKSAPVYYVRPAIDIKQLLTDALGNYSAAEQEATPGGGAEAVTAKGWVHVESVGEAIAQRTPSFSAQRYGYSDFTSFLASRADLIEFKEKSPQYVRLIAKKTRPQQEKHLATPKQLTNRSLKLKPRAQIKPNSLKTSPKTSTLTTGTQVIVPLLQFAGLSKEILHQKVGELAAIALPERWYFGAMPPADFTYPILKSYLRYTFVRLQHEGKVVASPSGAHRAFNTGLLDTLLRPIYGLFQKPTGEQHEGIWDLVFCIAGEGHDGKRLVAQFSNLPLAANYLSAPEKAFYDLSAGPPQVDWQHVVKDNMARLPLAFLDRYAPANFTPQNTQRLTTPEFFDYKRSFIAALAADPSGYRNIVSKLEEALERTLRRVQINYTTAVPTYYPKINSVDLLLPMCLVNESTVDFAIVTRREPSGKYIGHTILTLRQAYNNARLICKLDDHWLLRSMTLSQSAFENDSEEISETTADVARQ
ncbi:MAG: DUF3825 domain-containing protein, partial [Cyanobacteria bacterium J06598_3]